MKAITFYANEAIFMSEKDTVTDVKLINSVLDQCRTLRLGLRDGQRVYAVPVHYGYQEENGHYTLYFHGRPKGRRYELLKATHYAGFEIDDDDIFEPGQDNMACTYSASYRSVIGEGKVTLVMDPQEKQAAFGPLMQHYTGQTEFKYDPKSLAYVQVYRLDVTEMSCRIHQAE